MHICDNLHLEIVENPVFVLESVLSPEREGYPPNYIEVLPTLVEITYSYQADPEMFMVSKRKRREEG